MLKLRSLLNHKIYEEIISYLTLLSVAVWYMDDGGVYFCHNKRKMGRNISPVVYFCTDAFSIKSCELLMDYLRKKHSINTRLGKVKKLKNGTVPYNIYLNPDSVLRFFDIVRPYMIPSMMYKIDYEAWKRKKGVE